MAELSTSTVVGVLGAGAMGSGIAQVAAVHGHQVVLMDVRADAVARAHASVERALRREVEKGRMQSDEASAALSRLSIRSGGTDLEAFRGCGLIIEAIVENIDAKRQAFAAMEAVVDGTCVLATNTSSLPVTAIAAGCHEPERVIGIHFFNPAPVMPLVEIVPALTTSAGIASAARELIDSWGKTTVLATDTPGFIVNRIARPFYGESLRILEEGIADEATIDWAMREIGGFRMGPFELMDFIGNDVNYAVTTTVYEAFFHDPRYRPSLTQRRLVESRRLGRKTGRGYYDYAEGAPRPEPIADREVGARIVDRVLCMLINEAADAVYWRIASPEHIELAMTRGVNYPRGLLAWCDDLGAEHVVVRLDALHDEYREDRYRASPLLRRMAREGRRFFDA